MEQVVWHLICTDDRNPSLPQKTERSTEEYKDFVAAEERKARIAVALLRYGNGGVRSLGPMISERDEQQAAREAARALLASSTLTRSIGQRAAKHH